MIGGRSLAEALACAALLAGCGDVGVSAPLALRSAADGGAAFGEAPRA